jgi:hypothetical protein
MGNEGSIDEKFEALEAAALRAQSTTLIPALDKATRDDATKTGICYECQYKVDIHASDGHRDHCSVARYAKEGRLFAIWWKDAGNYTCHHCSSAAPYTSGMGAFCEQHAREYIAGRIGITPSASLEATVERTGMVLDVSSADGQYMGCITNISTIGDLRNAIMQMERARAAVEELPELNI